MPSPPFDETPSRTEREVEAALGRYASCVDDWSAFASASRRRLCPAVWANPDRIDTEGLLAELPGAVSVPWCGGAARWPSNRPGLHWAHRAGLYHVQEEASLLPVALLDVRPGQRILDLCAAPGGKTARIAFAVGPAGSVIANEPQVKRHAALNFNLHRLGLAQVTTTAIDGRHFTDGDGFDRVLVDAPCTAEGNLTGNLRRKPVAPRDRIAIATRQRQLLSRGIDLCRPGGRIVYATCTYAPEENEAVVETVLRRDDVELLEPSLPAELAVSRGLSAFEAMRFAPEVGGSARLWPHLAGTGGFFVAALLKRGASPSKRPAAVPPAPGAEALNLWDAIQERYDWPRDHGLVPIERGQSLSLVTAASRSSLTSFVSAGLPLIRRRKTSTKLATPAALRLGRGARRNVVQLEAHQVPRYQARHPLTLRPCQLVDASSGYVVVRYGPHALGMAMLRRSHASLLLVSEFPKAWALPHDCTSAPRGA
ncbi:MAG: RsmB/NOP family class I SAM-dependent RNA methyltransferase [Myxococcota bacterium]